jgi:membrane-anchored protein YejM (alkaline phosphatase superfamily)
VPVAGRRPAPPSAAQRCSTPPSVARRRPALFDAARVTVGARRASFTPVSASPRHPSPSRATQPENESPALPRPPGAPRRDPTRADRAASSARLWLLNLALVLPTTALYLRHAPSDLPLRGRAFAVMALVASLGLLSLPVAAATGALARWLPWPRLAAAVQGVLWAAFQLFVFVDTRIYALFRFHFNGTVWELLSTPGTGDSIHLGWRSPALVIGAAAALAVVLSLLGWRWAQKAAAPRPAAARLLRRRPALACLAAVLALTLVEKAVHAHADLVGDRVITGLSGMPPFYQRLTLRRTARRLLGVEPATVAVDVPAGQGVLRYPVEPVRLPAGGPRPSVILLVVDSLRRDALAPDTMPRTWELARQGRRFDDHLASANNTRFGIFGLMYGLHGTYWVPTFDERRRPAFVDALEAEGYDLAAFATASMSSPEIRQTALAGFDDRLHDALAHESDEPGDGELGRRATAWLRARRDRGDERPYFLFAFLDAPHQVYAYPPDEEVFRPAAHDVDYLELSGELTDEQLALLRNRYRNAVRHSDRVIGDILDEVAAGGPVAQDDTLVLVTGDHGEEFGENGFWGHNSNFSTEQVAVPLIVRGPGVTPGVESGPTIHLDVPATILEACGVPAAARPTYTLGGSLLDVGPRAVRVVSGWDRLALWTDDAVLWLPLAGHLGTTDVRTRDWRLVDDPDAVLRHRMPVILATVTECRRFLR